MKVLVEQFFCNPNVSYLFRLNEHSEQLLKRFEDDGINIAGVIDEGIPDDFCHGFPIIHHIDEVPADSIVVNCVINIWPQTVQKKLQSKGLRVIDLFSFQKYSIYKLDIYQWKGFAESYANNPEEYNKLRNLLADETSKDIFDRILRLRLEYDYSALSVFKENQDNQYFEPFLGLEKTGESFADIGGYDGLTTIKFVENCPDYNKIYYFEPEPDIMRDAQKRLSHLERIEYFEVAASDCRTTLYFESKTSGSKVSETGNLAIQADTIDSVITGNVTFLKMDIEGSESAAIAGAKHTILRCHPRLAVCVYHKGGDLIDIPNQVLAIRNDYDIYLRHYTEGLSETVMFFIPQK